MASAAQAAGSAVTPIVAYFQRLNAAMAAHGCAGAFLVVGIDSGAVEKDEQDGGAAPVRANAPGLSRPNRCPAARRGAAQRAPLSAPGARRSPPPSRSARCGTCCAPTRAALP